jgi:hypothetical protein
MPIPKVRRFGKVRVSKEWMEDGCVTSCNWAETLGTQKLKKQFVKAVSDLCRAHAGLHKEIARSFGRAK